MSRNKLRVFLLSCKRELRKEFNVFGATLEKVNFPIIIIIILAQKISPEAFSS